MNEEEFISSIDCCFPYGDREAAVQAIHMACSISPSAAFTVAYELARVPRSASVSKDILLDLLFELKNHFSHPLKDVVLGITDKIIVGERLPLATVLQAMYEIAHYPGEWQALNIAACALQDYPEQIEGEHMDQVDELYQSITTAWGHVRSSWPA